MASIPAEREWPAGWAPALTLTVMAGSAAGWRAAVAVAALIVALRTARPAPTVCTTVPGLPMAERLRPPAGIRRSARATAAAPSTLPVGPRRVDR